MFFSKYIQLLFVLTPMMFVSCSQKVSGISKVKNIPAKIAAKGIIVFLDSKCEDSKKVIPILRHINDMSDTNLTCILVINPINNSLTDMHQFIHENELSNWKAHLDEKNTIAKFNEVRKTPLVFVVNSSSQVLYQGLLADKSEPGNIQASPLIKAINSLSMKEKKLNNTSVNEGCNIE